MKQSIKLTESELKGLIAECINEAISTQPIGERGIDQEGYLGEVQNRIRKIYDFTSQLVRRLNELENYESDASKAPNPIITKLYDFLRFLRSKEFDAYLNNLTNRGAMSKGIMDYNPLTKRRTIDDD